ncbi:hypothetical protein HN011_003982, partial [Eciton burchellii]
MHILLAKTYSIDDIFRLEAEVVYPDIACDGKVKLNGSVGPFRLNNAGSFSINTTDIKMRWLITGPIKDDRWIIDHYHQIPIPKNAKIKLKNFVDSEEIIDLINEFVSKYWPTIYRAMRPVIMDTWEPWLIDRAN